MAKKGNKNKGGSKSVPKNHSELEKTEDSPDSNSVTPIQDKPNDTVEPDSQNSNQVVNSSSQLNETDQVEHRAEITESEAPIPSIQKDTNSTETDVPNTIDPSVNKEAITATSDVEVATPLAKPKKRLTLQERLALAAKGKSKTKDSSTPPPSLPQSSQNSTVVSPALSPVSTNEEPVAKEARLDEISVLKLKISELESSNSQLNERLSSLAKAPTKPSGSWTKEKSELVEKLAAKDDTIAQLMKEGETLSIKELKLNDTIKKLKSKNAELEENLHDYSEKSENALMKLNEVEDLVKLNGFKNLEQLVGEFTTLTSELSKLKTKLTQEQSWEKKYNDQQKILENELIKSKDCSIQLNDSKIALDLIKQQHELELESKNSIIQGLKQEVSSVKQTTTDEIARLENKIEVLRLESEYVPQQANGDTDVKSIDIMEFTKLSENHHNLQQQYLSSQENWKLIESNLLTKIDDLTTSIKTIRKSKLKVSNDFKKVNTSLSEQLSKYKSLEDEYKQVSAKHQELQLELEFKENDYNELQQKSNTFKKLYESDKNNLETKIKSLQETIEDMKKQELISPKGSLSRLESGLNINVDSRNNSLNNMYENPSWAIDSSINTPKVNSQIYFQNSMNRSTNSLLDIEDEAPDNFNEDEALDTFNDDSRSINSHGFSHNSFVSLTNTSNNRNIQLINKMSATTRRLEVELNTLKEENVQLTNEKEQMQSGLLDKYKLDEQMVQLNQQIEELNLQLQQRDKKEQTMLELIGEKTEQVEELKADVQDLKELCKLQVQQMIEFHESK